MQMWFYCFQDQVSSGVGEGNTPVLVMPHRMAAVALGWPGSQCPARSPCAPT